MADRSLGRECSTGFYSPYTRLSLRIFAHINSGLSAKELPRCFPNSLAGKRRGEPISPSFHRTSACPNQAFRRGQLNLKSILYDAIRLLVLKTSLISGPPESRRRILALRYPANGFSVPCAIGGMGFLPEPLVGRACLDCFAYRDAVHPHLILASKVG